MSASLHFGPRSSFGRWEAGLGVFALLLYAVSLSPNLLPADAGEYQLTGALLGVAHPPGFALYTVVSWLTTRLLFFVSPATAINLLSALLAALTLVLVSRTVRAMTGSLWAGICAACALGLSTTFWAQATTANIRMPTTLAVAWAVERLFAYERSLTVESAKVAETQSKTLRLTPLGGLALALGLGVSHHGSLIFVAVVLGVYALWLNPRVLLKPWPLLWGLLPFVAWLYFPLRASGYGAPPNLATLNGFLQHILARGFQGDMLYFANVEALPARLILFGNLLTFQFTPPVLAWMAAGMLAALWRNRTAGLMLITAWAVHSFIAITYRAPQTVEYLLPAYVLMALAMGFAFAELFRWPSYLVLLSSRSTPLEPRPLVTRSIAIGLSALTLLVQARATFPSYRALSRTASTRAYAEALLRQAPPQAVILANWHWATPLWYLQNVEQQRPDIEVRYVFPRTTSLAQDWVNEINTTLPTRPVLVTSFYPQEFNALPYRYLPVAQAWQVRAEPLTTPPPNLVNAQSQGEWLFHGSHFESDYTDPLADAYALTLAWSTSGPPQAVGVFVHLTGPDGLLYGQMDVGYPASRYVSGEILLDRFTLLPYPNAPEGMYALTTGVYRASDGLRLAEAVVGTLQRASSRTRLPPTCIPLGSEICLINSRLSPTGPVHAGDALDIDLEFQAMRPILTDYTVSVALTGPDYRWRILSDQTPVGGALPTLKWIAGSRLTDHHLLTIPMDAALGPAQLTLVMYDAFTQQSLPILDADLAAQGPALLLNTLEVVAP